MGSEQRPPWEVLNSPGAENCQLKEEREEEAVGMVRQRNGRMERKRRRSGLKMEGWFVMEGHKG